MNFRGVDISRKPEWFQRQMREALSGDLTNADSQLTNDTSYTPCVDSRQRQAPSRSDGDAARVQEFDVPAIGPSLNAYDRMHYRTRETLVKRWVDVVSLSLRQYGIVPVESYPVRVEMRCYFGPGCRRFDWDNLAPTAKLITDALRACGIIKNDSPGYVSGGSMQPLRTKQESYTEFKIIEEG